MSYPEGVGGFFGALIPKCKKQDLPALGGDNDAYWLGISCDRDKYPKYPKPTRNTRIANNVIIRICLTDKFACRYGVQRNSGQVRRLVS